MVRRITGRGQVRFAPRALSSNSAVKEGWREDKEGLTTQSGARNRN